MYNNTTTQNIVSIEGFNEKHECKFIAVFHPEKYFFQDGTGTIPGTAKEFIAVYKKSYPDLSFFVTEHKFNNFNKPIIYLQPKDNGPKPWRTNIY